MELRKKSTITIEVECYAPQDAFLPDLSYASVQTIEEVAEFGPLPCQGDGILFTGCEECYWGQVEWDGE